MTALRQSVAVVGAGDFIGAAIVRRFAAEGFAVHAGRRNGDKLAPLLGGSITGRSLDARQSEDVAAFLDEAEAIAPLALVVFNVGANVQFPLAETTDRVFRKVWEMACFAGFVTVREAARIMARAGLAKCSSPERRPACAAIPAMPRSPLPRPGCAPWPSPPRANCGRRESTSPIW